MSPHGVQPLARREVVGHTIEMILTPPALGAVVIMDIAVAPVATTTLMVDHRQQRPLQRDLIIIHLTIHRLIIDIIHIHIIHRHLTTVQIVTLKDQVTFHQEVT